MSTDYRSGTRLSLLVYGSYSWGLGFYNPSWNLKKDGHTDVAAYIDGQLVTTGKALHITEAIAVLPLEGGNVYRSLQLGRILILKTPAGDLGFSLDGTAKAMDAVLDCVKTLPTSTAAGTPAPQPTSNFQYISPSELAVLLTNLLNQASVTGYRLNPPGNSGASFSLANGTGGFLLAGHGSGTDGADDFAAMVIRSDAERCKGDFRSGKKAVELVDGSVIRKIITNCQSASLSTVNETTVVRRNDGFLISLTHVYPEGLTCPRVFGPGIT